MGDVSVAVEPVGESVGAWWLRGRWSGQLPLRVLWGRFWVSLPVPEVGQVGFPLASKAPGFDGVLDSFPYSLLLFIIIIEFSYYLLLNLIFSPWRRKTDLRFSAWRKRKLYSVFLNF